MTRRNPAIESERSENATNGKDALSDEKMNRLRGRLRELGSVLIAFSGGVDSTFLLKVAHQELGNRAMAATAVSPIHSAREEEDARTLARHIGVRHLIVKGEEMASEAFRRNPPDRCYLCKKTLFSKLKELAAGHHLAAVCDGSNVDDQGDYRPGARAISELGIESPLVTTGFTKADIRRESEKLGLSTWDKPAFACLASRFPYGTEITPEKLRRIDEAEEVVRRFVKGQCRVRDHGTVARIEVEPERLDEAVAVADQLVAEIESSGFNYVALDLRGYRTGSLNETLAD